MDKGKTKFENASHGVVPQSIDCAKESQSHLQPQVEEVIAVICLRLALSLQTRTHTLRQSIRSK